MATEVLHHAPRHRYKRILVVTAVVLVTAVAFASWYKIHYSKAPARSFEVNNLTSEPRVLIATQGSRFKDAVVDGVVTQLKSRGAYIKVVDVSELPRVDENAWNAIVLISSWEMRHAEPNVKAFVDKSRHTKNVVVMNTSGRGDFKMEGVDAISGASVMADVPGRVAILMNRIDTALKAK